MSTPDLQLDRDASGRARLRLSGDWTLARLAEAQRALASLPRELPVASVDAIVGYHMLIRSQHVSVI